MNKNITRIQSKGNVKKYNGFWQVEPYTPSINSEDLMVPPVIRCQTVDPPPRAQGTLRLSGVQNFSYKVNLIKACFKKCSHLGLKVPWCFQQPWCKWKKRNAPWADVKIKLGVMLIKMNPRNDSALGKEINMKTYTHNTHSHIDCNTIRRGRQKH